MVTEELKETLAEFVKWLKLKVQIHITETLGPSYKTREVWWVNMGLNVGSEQNGKNKKFERPVLVLRKFGHNIFWAIPMTSKKKDTPYHFECEYKKYYKDEQGILQSETKQGIMILNQLKSMSRKRLIRKNGIISKEDFENVREEIKKLM